MRSLWLPLASLGAFLAAFLGMSWNMLEPRMSFPMGTNVMLVTAAVASAISRVGGKTRPFVTIVVVGLAVPSGAFVSMLLAMVKDPTAFNLWPIALITLGLAAFAASSVGTLVGSGLLLISRR